MPRIFSLETVHLSRQLLLNLTSFFCCEEGTSLLFSGGDQETARHSYLFLFPHEQISIQNKLIRHRSIGTNKAYELNEECPWEHLKKTFSLSQNNSYPEWVGFFSYEMGTRAAEHKTSWAEPAWADPAWAEPAWAAPDAHFQRSSITLSVDHAKNEATVIIADQAHYLEKDDQLAWVKMLESPSGWEELLQYLISLPSQNNNRAATRPIIAVETKESYISKILKAKELIKNGDVYQINLSQKFLVKDHIAPFSIFQRLNALNPAPFSAYFNLEKSSIISSSPERFLSLRQGELETRPIKGTRPRGKTLEEDAKNREQLLASEKEKSELLMITDLMRNDLGKISMPGSVKVEEMMRCESYENVFHLVSIIRSKILPDLHPLDVIRSCFPGGSITGCPKLSAIQIISDLEQRSRGIYTGAIGYITGQGDFDFNVAIRTIVQDENHIDIQLGGAIVADSDPEEEYEETLHKGASIFKALDASLSK